MSTIKYAAMLATLATLLSGAPSSARADEAFTARLTTAQVRLGLDLVQRLSTTPRSVVAVSPASIAGAAVALDLGASPQLRDALNGALDLGPKAEAADNLLKLRERVAALGAPQQQSSPLKLGRSIAFDHSLNLHPGLADAMQRAGIKQDVIDFTAPTAAETINRRVREQTAGKIPEIVDRLSGDTSLVVLDALYFNDHWKTPFDRARTAPEPFKRVNASPITVSTMHLSQGHYLFRQDDRFVAVELPFADQRYRMVVVTTRGQEAAPVAGFLPAEEWLAGKGFMLAAGEVALPHFDVSSRDDLTPALDARGLGAARTSPHALSGFTDDPIRVTRVVQCLQLRLNEEGTEVAAATAAVADRGIEGHYVNMIVDRPFVFALRDATTGLVLATGYVGEPSPLATASRP
jgi:serpin B